ncbi:MAG: c-type cytochrome [Gammaproteobacteria bacterium]|nr:c-type cytochrome [Gammaproteobacteria bacterium]
MLSLGALTVAANHDSDESIAERISAVGSLCIEGEKCKAPVAKAAAAPTGPRSGEDVYAGSCAACHSTGAAGAPKLGDVAAWAPRVDKGVETLFANALNGFNGMPAKGMCMDCSDDEIKDAVTHMLDNSK